MKTQPVLNQCSHTNFARFLHDLFGNFSTDEWDIGKSNLVQQTENSSLPKFYSGQKSQPPGAHAFQSRLSAETGQVF